MPSVTGAVQEISVLTLVQVLPRLIIMEPGILILMQNLNNSNGIAGVFNNMVGGILNKTGAGYNLPQ